METIGTRKSRLEATVPRLLYGGFVLMAIYYAILPRDFGDAAMNLGIALAFDPFDQSVSWKERPLYQRAWLIVHLVLLAMAALAAIYLS
jgi:hypothetical protein